MPIQRLAFGLLASAGVALGHIVGYIAAHPDAAAREAALTGHAYLSPVATVLVPIGVVATLVWAVQCARDAGVRPATRTLAAAQVGLFLIQEVVERLSAGLGTGEVLGIVAAERGVWFGLVAQVLVAAAVVHLIGRVGAIVARLTRSPRRTSAHRRHRSLGVPALAPPSLIGRAQPGRGPPVLG